MEYMSKNPPQDEERDNQRNHQSSSSSTPTTPKPTTPRSDPNSNPYPTTFVQADTSNFKHVVQMLTGSEAFKQQTPHRQQIPPKRQGFKLYERRNSLIKNSLAINTLVRNAPPEILSPSLLDFPSLTLSPVTPLGNSSEEEERVIAEKGFYLHPKSPMSKPSHSNSHPPQLLPLFPLTSPRLSDQ